MRMWFASLNCGQTSACLVAASIWLWSLVAQTSLRVHGSWSEVAMQLWVNCCWCRFVWVCHS